MVDLCCVSRGLYSSVQSLEVLPHMDALSQDHSALVLCVHLPAPSDPPPDPTAERRRVRVVRPHEVAYASALRLNAPRFQALLASWQAGQVSVESAHAQFVSLVQVVARAAGAGGSAGGP